MVEEYGRPFVNGRIRAVAAGVLASALLLVVAPDRSGAQVADIDDPLGDYLRILQIGGWTVPGSFTVRSAGRAGWALPEGVAHPWRARAAPRDAEVPSVALADARLRLFANSSYPVGQNDGSVWRGRGLTTALDFGGSARWGRLAVTLRPTVTHVRNDYFELAPVPAGRSELSYPWRTIDLPQRFGRSAYSDLDWGQSEIAVVVGGARLGFGTQNMWWGPALRNPILMSNNAAGFPHGYLGTERPVQTGIGTFEARWIWGRLEQSEYFDVSVSSEDRFLTGAVASYSPDFVEGLTVGFTRIFYGLVPEGGVELGDYFLVFQGVTKSQFATPDNPRGEDDQDQMLSLFWRWVLAESGFEFFGEWARNDHSWDFGDFVLEPEHSQAYTLGFQKRFEVGRRVLVAWSELNKVERSRTVAARPSPVYYTHHIVRQGYTHRGQVVGAGVGPGGSAQYGGLDLYDARGRVGVWIQRGVHDNDAYYAYAESNDLGFCCHDVALRMGGHATYFSGPFDLGGRLVLTRRFNRNFGEDESWNLGLEAVARFRPDLLR